MKHIRSLLALTLVTGLVTAGVQAQQSPWPKFRHDTKNTGQTPYTGPSTPTLAWTFAATDGIASSPTIGADGTIYVGGGWHFDDSVDPCMYALNPDGSLKWCFETLAGVQGWFSSPIIGPDGTLYASALDGRLYAFEDSVTYAKEKWFAYLEYPWLMSSPTVAADGSVHVGSPSFGYYVYEPDGTQRSRYLTDWCIISSPAIADDGTVIIGSKDHNVFAFNDTQEDPIWTFSTGTFFDGHLVDASPAIGPDGTIYVGTDARGAFAIAEIPVDTSFWAINPDGTHKWSLSIGHGVESSAAIGPNNRVYFGSYNRLLYAVTDAGTHGVVDWTFETNGEIDGSPTVDGDGNIYFGSRDSTIYSLSPDGSVRWTYKTGDGIESSPTIDDRGYLYIGCFDGNLYVLGTGAPDAGVVSIDILDQILVGQTITPLVTVTNFRSEAASFDVTLVIDTNGTIIYNETVSVTELGDRASEQIAFSDWTIDTDGGIAYNITASALLPADDNTGNDQLTQQTESVAGCICGQYTGGYTGNVNCDISGKRNLADISKLIDRVYISKAELCCEANGNINGDLEGKINLADISKLIDHVYISKAETAPCN